MERLSSLIGILALAVSLAPLKGQELQPRAYVVSPVGVNVFVAGYSYSQGDVVFDPTLPIEDVGAKINISSLTFGRTLNVFGRSGQATLTLPYVWGSMDGIYIGVPTGITRSGIADLRARFAVNLVGAPAMNLGKFAKYKQKTNVGLSFTLAAPSGQYDSAKLINIGSNRWSFKPEAGVSQAVGNWLIDVYAGVWFFTDNKNFNSGLVRSQKPIGSLQFHFSRTLKPGMWLAFNANFYTGGRTEVDGVPNSDLQKTSRLGATFALPLARRHSLKVVAHTGAYSRIGADFNVFSVGYQYVWGGGF
jgi:hypothetical protein